MPRAWSTRGSSCIGAMSGCAIPSCWRQRCSPVAGWRQAAPAGEDGSVVLARPMAIPSFGLRAPARTYEPPPVVQQLQPSDAPVMAQAAPVRPARPARRVVPEVKMWKPAMVKAPFLPSESSKQLACRNETAAGGRVRVVCE